MSESNSDNKKVEDAAVSEVKSDDVETVVKAKKTTKAKKVESVVASEAVTEEVAVEKEAVTAAPYIAATKVEEVKKSSSTGTYMAIAAGVLLVVTLTAVTFFQDEYDSVVASLTSIITEENTQDVDLTAVEAEVSNDQVQTFDQIVQANNGYQSFAMNQDRASAFEEMRQNRRAAFEESKRKHDERMAEMYQLRTAAFERMDKNQTEMRNKMEVLRTKTQQIQLEMQQKMQTAYNEFHSI